MGASCIKKINRGAQKYGVECADGTVRENSSHHKFITTKDTKVHEGNSLKIKFNFCVGVCGAGLSWNRGGDSFVII